MNPFHSRVHIVLRHDNMQGRNQQTIHTSVTQIDLHDFSRLSATYALGGFHCVTQLQSQLDLCRDMLTFWREDLAKNYNPDRVAALAKLHIHDDFENVVDMVGRQNGQPPILIGTSAKPHHKNLDFPEVSRIIGNSGRPALVLFGTGWGMKPEQLERCDWVLPPIAGLDGYNHLSVRCAAAVIVDRLLISACQIRS